MLKNIFKWFALSRTKTNHRTAHNRTLGVSRRLRHEILEDRRMLATLTVNVDYDVSSNNDDGSLTLREAIAVVSGTFTPTDQNGDKTQIDIIAEPLGTNDKIVFALSPNKDTITLGKDAAGNNLNLGSEAGELKITKPVTIDAQGQDITIDAGNGDDNIFGTGDGSRVIKIELSALAGVTQQVTLDGLTITGGDTDDTGDTDDDFLSGGGVRFFGTANGVGANITFTLRDSTIVGNATSDVVTEGGGGLYASGAGTNSGVLQINLLRSLFKDNHAASTNDSNIPQGGGGAYVVVAGAATALIQDSQFINNVAEQAGGGLYVHVDPTFSNTVASATVENSEFTGNTAQGAGSFEGGGGLFVDLDGLTIEPTPGEETGIDATSAIFNLFDSTIDHNTSTANSGGGVLVCVKHGGTFNATNSTISNNHALGNSAVDGRGGGLALLRSPIDTTPMVANFNHLTITENESNISVNSSAGLGGGFFSGDLGGGVTNSQTITTLTNTIVSGNRAVNSSGTATDNNIAGKINLVDSVFNLIGTGTASNPTGTGNITTNDNNSDPSQGPLIDADNPGLMPLGHYGGPTKTHKPEDDSLVIDAGDPSFADPLATDQRGFSRIKDIESGPIVDIGAVEVHSLAPIVTEVVISNSSTLATHSYFDAVSDTSQVLGNQLRALRFSEADTIAITFSEDVIVPANALRARAINRGVEYQLDNLGYDNTTFTNTWKLSSSNTDTAFQSFGQNETDSVADQVLLFLDDTVKAAAVDQALLDGEWINPAKLAPDVVNPMDDKDLNTDLISRFPSGDGEAGGDFRFVFTTYMPGDFDNSNLVGQGDLDLVLLNWGDPQSIAAWLTEYADNNNMIGQAELDMVLLNWGDNMLLLEFVDALGDYNGDGFVGQADLDLVLLNWGSTLNEEQLNDIGWLSLMPIDELIGQSQLDSVLLNWGDGWFFDTNENA